MVAKWMETPSASPSEKRKNSAEEENHDKTERAYALTKNPKIVNSCRGMIVKPVMRSKFSLMSLYMLYFDSPASRAACSTSISAGFEENVYAVCGNEQRAFVCFENRLDHVASVRAEHAALVFHSDVRHFVPREVHDFRAVASQGGVLALFADAADAVATLVDFREQFAMFLRAGFWRSASSVTITSPRAVERGDDCRVLSVVAVKY